MSDNEEDDVSLRSSENESGNEEDDVSLKSSENESDNDENGISGASTDGRVKKKNDNSKLSEGDHEKESDFEDDFYNSIDTFNPLLRNRTKSGITTISAVNIRAEIEKGNSTREQLSIWESLLEMRIKLQKCLINSNKMPQYDVYKTYKLNGEFQDKCIDLKSKLQELLNNLLQLQSSLVNNFPETKNIFIQSKKRKLNAQESKLNDDSMDEEIPSDTDGEINDEESSNDPEEPKEELNNKKRKESARKRIKLSEFEGVLAKNHKAYIDFRNSVIQKWNDKTKIASGIISKRADQSILSQIEFILKDKEKLLKKTQLKRSEYDIIGKDASSLEDNDGHRVQEYDSEIYDDDDFYHQLLRDLIECKSADVTDPIQLSKQWIQLQNMRSKMKRKIDTRATKGRRIRYTVHQKLVNLMAPITVNDTWTDHAKDELFSSLFGKTKLIKEQASTL
jgi:protein AATF/BFR2